MGIDKRQKRPRDRATEGQRTAKPGGFGARSIEMLWGEKERPRRGPKPGLSVDQIVRTAIAMADAQGLAAVSMDRVAGELGFTEMSLYRYVPGKSELIDLMLDVGLGEAPVLDGASGAWRSKLEEWARQLWLVFDRHPWSLEASGRLRVMGPNELAWLESALGALSTTGLTRRERHAACLVVLGHVRSMAQFSVKMPQGQRGLTGVEWEVATRELLQKHGDRYPELIATLSSRALGPSRNDPLKFGLRCVLDGIGLLVAEHETARLKKHSRRSKT
jgi:AcrR family transcriptional regulator